MLKKLLNKYLKGSEKIIFTDCERSYLRSEFLKKVIFYKKKLDIEWKSNKKNRGIAIKISRTIDYFAIIFASWLSNGYYVPLSKNISRKNFNIQIKKSLVSIVAVEKKNRIYFEKVNLHNQKKFNDLSYIIFTSGSTGDKKGVKISNKSFESYIGSIKKKFSKNFNPKSLLINGEISFDIVNADIAFALIFDSEICVTKDTQNLFSFFEILEKRKIESVYAVPSAWNAILYYAIAEKKDYSFIKYINSGGEILNLQLYKKIKKIAPHSIVHNFYGPTEFTINTHYQKVENKKNLFHNNIATVGKLFSNISYKLVKNKKEDKFGELLLNGHQMTQGYINSIVKPFSKINKKIYYKTGDNFFKIKDKFFYHSRLDSYIKILGYRVNLESLENKLLKTLSVNNFLYVKDLKIILVIKRVKKNKMNRVKNFINKNFEWYEKPKEIKIVNELPTLPNGKINRKYYS